MKEAVLIVSFGTTHLDTLEKTIAAVERDVQTAYPELTCRRAFTSGIVRSRLWAQSGIRADSVEEAFSRLAAEHFTRVTVQPTLLIPGEEYDLLRRDVLRCAGDLEVRIGLPLLWDDADCAAIADLLHNAYPTGEGGVLLAMGHGTGHSADGIYDRLLAHLRRRGAELCTVEGSIGFDRAIETMCARPERRARLVPLLLVAGDHSKNDMAGDGPESLKSRLQAAGFTVECTLRGLGELSAVRARYLRRIAAARA